MIFKVNNSIARIILFQRNEILNKTQKKLRKILGRYLFTQLISRFVNKEKVAKKYYMICKKENYFLKKFLKKKMNILSIGGGLGGVESLVLSKNKNYIVDMIERNFISNKIQYFWNPYEAYNKLNLTNLFIFNNSDNYKNFKIFDYDKKKLPKKKYDLIFSFFSMDYHYDFNIYKKFLIKSSNKNTIFIFDTIRANYFFKIFKKVKIYKVKNDKIHQSTRVVCKEFI